MCSGASEQAAPARTILAARYSTVTTPQVWGTFSLMRGFWISTRRQQSRLPGLLARPTLCLRCYLPATGPVHRGEAASVIPVGRGQKSPETAPRAAILHQLAIAFAIAAFGAGIWLAWWLPPDGTVQYSLNCAQTSYSYWQATFSNGAVARHYELRAGDISPRDAEYTDGRQRCETVGRTEYPLRTDLWFSYSFRWTGEMPGGDRNWNVMTQLRQPLEAAETPGKPPAFTMRHVRGNLELATRSDTRKNTTTQVDEVVRKRLPWFPANTWQNIVVRVKFDPFGQGNITFWLNGQKVYASGQIPIGYNDSFGPHFSQGQYRGATDATTAHDFANVEFGTKSLLDRVTQPKPLPN
jgi:hypothetical protein